MRPTSGTSQIHSVPAWLRSASRLRSGMMSRISASTSRLAEHGLAFDRADLAVDANRRARLRRQVQRRCAARGGDAKQAIDARRVGRRKSRGLIDAHMRARQRQHDGRTRLGFVDLGPPHAGRGRYLHRTGLALRLDGNRRRFRKRCRDLRRRFRCLIRRDNRSRYRFNHGRGLDDHFRCGLNVQRDFVDVMMLLRMRRRSSFR